jgi:hypothetical protein
MPKRDGCGVRSKVAIHRGGEQELSDSLIQKDSDSGRKSTWYCMKISPNSE